MKPTIYILLLMSAIAVSCTGKKQTDSADKRMPDSIAAGYKIGAIAFDSIVLEQKYKLLPNEPDSVPCATVSIKFIYPSAFRSAEELQKLQAAFYRVVLGEKAAGATSPQQAVDMVTDDFVSRYRDRPAKEYREEIAEDDGYISYSNYSHTLNISNRIDFRNESLVGISAYSTEYYGGSGSSGSYQGKEAAINLNTQAEVKEADIFVAHYREPLAKIVRQKLLEFLKMEAACGSGMSDDELKSEFFRDFNGIYPNNHFTMDDKGLHYAYNPGEIASYSTGSFEADIPYAEVAHLLNPDAFAKFFPDMDLQKEMENYQQQVEANSKTVVDMFLLLPDEAFNGEYPPALRQKMVKYPDKTHVIKGKEKQYGGCAIIYPEVNLIWANYETSFAEHKVYYRKISLGKNLVTVINHSAITAYWYENGKLTRDKDFYDFVNENSNYTARDFFDLDKVSKEVAKYTEEYIETSFGFVDTSLEISENGVITIFVSYDNPYEYNNYEILQPHSYYLKFERVGDKWTKKRIKKYSADE